MNIKVRCPYCGNDMVINQEDQAEEQIVLCDWEEGGCDRLVLVINPKGEEPTGKTID